MWELSQILKFIKDQTGSCDVFEHSDIVEGLGCDGDDFDELIGAFSKAYNVDMSSYLWYFHCSEEGSQNSIGGSIFRSPDKRVNRIPVTPLMLLDFAQKGKWDIQYPEYTFPKRRYDIVINLALVIILMILIVYKCVAR